MKTTSNKVLKAAAIASLLAGGAIAGSFISTESAQAQTTTVQAQDSQSRVSGAVTNTFSNGIANSFAAEILYPQNDYAPSGTVSMSISYGTAGGDASKVVITGATMSGPVTTYSASTVEAATARAIDGARTASRFDDVNGIVKSWRDSNGLD
ncbi:TEK-like protein [Aphanizomenon flos-aquae]|uniref:TEK-like protein n=1 Tax=Aphanizomenon flos-aquae TaxID=1176 RepID=UPI0016800088|nr:TEK-like protein [Aphanizomenon flos-aquae]MBD2391222.1 TEK-like protein [Aphanizomenon flos-aquae FACHB-1171]MBD2558163.1 TEK-like protein [Aphanizomenon flos-aquae FACHB-1290]MBD2657903.1 TEK-like protein [Aphanizomenon flos-aquae FACHB-1265]MBD2697753.1 TEK-like protein [Aphanizomenon flos-aquae FACHB-1287]